MNHNVLYRRRLPQAVIRIALSACISVMIPLKACWAAEFCVSTTQELEDALIIASAVFQNHVIKIRSREGMPGSSAYELTTDTIYHSGHTGSLTIKGGYMDAGCSESGRSSDARMTKIVGRAASSNPTDIVGRGHVTVERISFSGCQALAISAESSDVTVDSSAFTSTCSYGGALLTFRAAHARIRNSLFVGGSYAASIGATNIAVANSTFVATANSSQFPVFTATDASSTDPSTSVALYDNIFHGAGSTSIRLGSPTSSLPFGYAIGFNNTYATMQGNWAVGSLENSTATPLFDSEYRPQVTPVPSPTIDAGTSSVPGGVPMTDLFGGARNRGAEIDRGALESSWDSGAVLVVNNISSSPTVENSLPWAVAQANSVPASASEPRIHFSGSVFDTGAIIVLFNDLQITRSMTIDGTTVPGWIANTSVDGFNATLPVLVSRYHGSTVFKVPSSAPSGTRLSVRGLALSADTSAVAGVIDLAGGKGHVISGNQIGGTRPSGEHPPTGGRGIMVRSGVEDVSISGNIVTGATVAGVHIVDGAYGTVVSHNLIGSDVDGGNAPSAGNGSGILMAGRANVEVASNRIRNNGNGISIAPGTSIDKPSIHDNLIDFNDGHGVAVVGDAQTNALIVGNRFEHNSGAGVSIVPPLTSASNFLGGTFMQRNTFLDNADTSNWQGIDFAAAGPDANGDPADLDGVPNAPELTQVIASSGGEVHVLGTLPRRNPDELAAFGAYRLDLYAFRGNCVGHKPQVSDFLGSVTVVPQSAGGADFVFANVLLPQTSGSEQISLTATASTTIESNTSPLSACILVPDTEHIFADGFDPVN